MKKILFYATNGVGVGHLQRIRLIAEEIRPQNVKIILVSSTRFPGIFGKFFDYFVRLIPLSDELLQSPAKTLAAQLVNGRRFARTLERFRPDLIVSDFHLTSPFTFYAFGFAVKYFPTSSVFIWRLEDVRTFCRDLKEEKAKLNFFEKIIFPHSRQELRDLLPPFLFRQIELDSKFKICGPIFRKSDKSAINFCRHKYGISCRDFFITVTLGGGGKSTGRQCEDPGKIIKNFFAVYPWLTKAIPNMKTLVITGPYFENYENRIPLGLRVVKFENNLPSLIKISDLVISAAGYNTCNELVQTKTPAILFPLLRGNREQFERAFYFEKKGIARVFEGGSPRQFFDLIIDCRNNLDKMRLNFRKFSVWGQGNKMAAKMILDLLEH